MTSKHKSLRRCYWCLEAECLSKRKLEETGIVAKDAESRLKLDTATKNMWKKEEEVNNRSAAGAEVLLVGIALPANVVQASI